MLIYVVSQGSQDLTLFLQLALGFFVLGLYSGVSFVTYGIVPALVVASLLEYCAIRKMRIYLTTGAFIFVIFGTTIRLQEIAAGANWLFGRVAWSLVSMAAAGLIFGLVYWSIAGRNAGLRKLEMP